MTSPMDLPLFGKVKLFETTKTELLELWQTVLKKNNITVNENSKVEVIVSENGIFKVVTPRVNIHRCRHFARHRPAGYTAQTEYSG